MATCGVSQEVLTDKDAISNEAHHQRLLWAGLSTRALTFASGHRLFPRKSEKHPWYEKQALRDVLVVADCVRHLSRIYGGTFWPLHRLSLDV
jgi:hypothetical protein